MSAIVPSPEIDIAYCSVALRSVTDELALHARRPGAGDSVRDILPPLFELASRGRAMLAGLLAPFHPDVGWGGGETDAGLTLAAIRDRRWLYDPIDGAYHFVQGLPLWSASLALVDDGEIVLALVYDPTMNEMFVARRGRGTSVNGRAIAVTEKKVLGAAVVGTGLPIYGHGDRSLHTHALSQLAEVSRKVFVVRQMASASLQLAYVAAGRLDAYWETGYDLHDWAAGALIVREAGGIVTDFKGLPFEQGGNGIVAGPESFVAGLRSSGLGEQANKTS